MFALSRTTTLRTPFFHHTFFRFASQFQVAPEGQRVDQLRPKKNEMHSLVHQSAFQRPFIVDAANPLQVPIFSLVSGQFKQETITLDPEVFN